MSEYGIKVEFYTVTKRVNSTALPGAHADFNCNLKNASSIDNPSIELAAGTLANPSKYNYAHVPDFNRYYWVHWTFSNGIWTADMSCDVLASFRYYILSSTKYVLRAAADFDGTIKDTFYPCKTGAQWKHAVAARPWAGQVYNYVVHVIGNNLGGYTQYVGLTQSQYANWGTLLFNVDEEDGLTPFQRKLKDLNDDYDINTLNPLQYITSCHALPFHVGGAAEQIHLGPYTDATLNGHVLGAKPSYKVPTIDITIPKHPQAEERGDYLNASPYSSYTLFAPPWGEIQIAGEDVKNDNHLWLDITCDLTNGNSLLQVHTAGGKQLFSGWAVIGYDAPIASITTASKGQTVSTIAGVVGGVAGIGLGALAMATGVGAIAGGLSVAGGVSALAGVATGIGNAVDENAGRASIVGDAANGQTITDSTPFILKGTFSMLVDENIAENGRPLCKNKTLGSLHGYVLCADGEVSAPATETELTQIANYLTTGVFIE